jgi:hypothetical protein
MAITWGTRRLLVSVVEFLERIGETCREIHCNTTMQNASPGTPREIGEEEVGRIKSSVSRSQTRRFLLGIEQHGDSDI